MARRIPDAERHRYVLYLRGHREPDQHKRTWVPIFWEPALAKLLIERFLGNEEPERDGNRITVPGTAFSITCEDLDAILDADTTGFQLDDKMAHDAMRFRMGSWEEDHSKEVVEVETVTESGEVITIKEKKPKAAKPPKEKRPTKPDNYVTITEWCEKWKIKPLHARTCLRASDLVKPEYGWAFDPKDEKKIKKICGVK